MQPSEINKGDRIYLYRFPRLKLGIVRQCFSGYEITHIKKGQLPDSGWLVLWGMKPAPEGLSREVRIIRMEDGFLRSVGLGADLVQALSIAIDREGIYFDATRPSELEIILQTGEFDEARGLFCGKKYYLWALPNIIWADASGCVLRKPAG